MSNKLTGRNNCSLLLFVMNGINTAIAIKGVKLAGIINLAKTIQKINKPADLKNPFIMIILSYGYLKKSVYQMEKI